MEEQQTAENWRRRRLPRQTASPASLAPTGKSQPQKSERNTFDSGEEIQLDNEGNTFSKPYISCALKKVKELHVMFCSKYS